MPASTDRSALERELRRLAITPSVDPTHPPRIGVEVEMLVVNAATRRACPIEAEPGDASAEAIASLAWLAPLAARKGWRAARTPKGAPCFSLADGGAIGFEPGGQIEYSSAPHRSASALIGSVRDVVASLRGAADDAGVELLHLGIDPVNPIEAVPLRLDAERYTRMDAYFESRGASGRVMMRQTAATQVSLDFGTPAQMTRRWRVLERMAPTMIAAFANSPRHAGAETGHRSFRSHVWRTLDLTRTGLVIAGDDPAADYVDFALDAPVMLHRPPDGEYPTLRTLIERGDADRADLADHLSTLFPEIRPRGHFEVRSTDAIPMGGLPALIVLLGGIVYDSSALRTAEEVLHGASPDLVAAGRAGLSDPSLACVARDLFEVALSGCLRLGDSFLEREHLEEAAAFITACPALGASWNEREMTGRSPVTRNQAVASLAAPR